jgi:hypothetical protein
MVPEVIRDEVAPGDSIGVPVTANYSGKVGRQFDQVQLTTDHGDPVRLTLTAHIRAGLVTVPSNLNLGTLSRAHELRREVRVVDTERRSAVILPLPPSTPGVELRRSDTESTGGSDALFELVLRPGELPLGRNELTLEFELSGEPGQRAKLVVAYHLPAAYEPMTPSLRFRPERGREAQIAHFRKVDSSSPAHFELAGPGKSHFVIQSIQHVKVDGEDCVEVVVLPAEQAPMRTTSRLVCLVGGEEVSSVALIHF